VADRQEQNRCRVRVGRRYTGVGILRAWSRLHTEDADAFAVGDAGKTIGDADADTLLAADDGSDTRHRRGFDHRVSRIAGEKLYAFAFQDFSDHVDDFHDNLQGKS